MHSLLARRCCIRRPAAQCACLPMEQPHASGSVIAMCITDVNLSLNDSRCSGARQISTPIRVTAVPGQPAINQLHLCPVNDSPTFGCFQHLLLEVQHVQHLVLMHEALPQAASRAGHQPAATARQPATVAVCTLMSHQQQCCGVGAAPGPSGTSSICTKDFPVVSALSGQHQPVWCGVV